MFGNETEDLFSLVSADNLLFVILVVMRHSGVITE